jgi:transposase
VAVNQIVLTTSQREELEALVRCTGQAALARRARVVLLTAEGVAAVEIAARLRLSPEAVSRIRKRFLDGGIEALRDRPKAGRKDHALTSDTVEYIVQLALSPPPRGRSRWTTRLLASYFGITSGAVSDVLRKSGLQPHRMSTYEVSRDPRLAEKVKDVVGLYLSPPEHAAVLSLDEMTSIRALEHTRLPLPGSTHGDEQRGVFELHAALEAATGKATRALERRRTRADCVSFLKKVERASPGEELHVILDNSSSHGTPELREWLAENPSVRVHYTPTSTSWLKQVGGFFDILGKQSLSGADFKSEKALRQHLRAYLRASKKNAPPFEWIKRRRPPAAPG